MKEDKNEIVDNKKKIVDEKKLKSGGNIPVICERAPECKDLKELKRKKFLLKPELTLLKFYTILVELLEINKKEDALFLLASGKYVLSLSDTFQTIYAKYKEKDNILHINYTAKEIFG